MSLWQVILTLVAIGGIWYVAITWLTFGNPAIKMIFNVIGAVALIFLILQLTGFGNVHIGR